MGLLLLATETSVRISKKGMANLAATAEALGLIRVYGPPGGSVSALVRAIGDQSPQTMADALSSLLGGNIGTPSRSPVKLLIDDDQFDNLTELAKLLGCTATHGPLKRRGIGSISLLLRKLGDVNPDTLSRILTPLLE